MTKRDRDRLRREAIAAMTAATLRYDELMAELEAVRAVRANAMKVLRTLETETTRGRKRA